MIKEKLIEKFGGDVNHMSCVYLRDGEKRLRELLFKCDTIIEIGTYRGVSSAVLSEYAKRVFSFDVVEQSLRQTFMNYLNIDNVVFDIVKNREDEIKKVSEVFENNKVDLCFIDGEHFDGELEKDFEMCKQCKTIIIHDYTKTFPEVYHFVNALDGYKKEINDTFVKLTRLKENTTIEENNDKPKTKIRRRRSNAKRV